MAPTRSRCSWATAPRTRWCPSAPANRARRCCASSVSRSTGTPTRCRIRSAWRRSATLATGWRQGWLANDLKPLLQGSARLRAVRRARIAPASRGGYYRREPAHRCPEDATTMKVVIADDEPLARERLRLLLAEHPDLQLVAEAGDGREALHACAEHDADLVLLRSEEHTSELQSLMRISYAVFCLKKKTLHTKASRATHT